MLKIFERKAVCRRDSGERQGWHEDVRAGPGRPDQESSEEEEQFEQTLHGQSRGQPVQLQKLCHQQKNHSQNTQKKVSQKVNVAYIIIEWKRL